MTTKISKLDLVLGDVSKENILSPCCQKEMRLGLHPDYISSGIWCFHCGCMLNDIENVPQGLIDLCGVWNDLWDHQINKTAYIDDNYFSKVFITTGKIFM